MCVSVSVCVCACACDRVCRNTYVTEVKHGIHMQQAYIFLCSLLLNTRLSALMLRGVS